MKWTEPWFLTVRNQERFNLISKPFLISFLSWSVGLASLMVLKSLVDSGGINYSARLVLTSFLIGFVLSIFIYTYRWLSPFKIESGPNGIVRKKGDRIILLSWKNISAFRFSDNKLILSFNNGSETELFLPKNLDTRPVKAELEINLGKADGKQF